jgi:hypothetical protein
MILLRRIPLGARWQVINATEEFILDLQDQVQGVAQMLAWLIARAGGDPSVIGSVPRDVPPRGVRAA